MATNDDPASGIMPASKLKPLLLLSKRQAVSCAVGLTRDKQAIVLLHRRTKPRKLLAEMRKKASSAGVTLDAASLRFGRASVNGGSDSTMVTFTVNKPAPGPLRMKLLERLRPAGFQRCEIVVDEALENEGEDDAPDEEAEAGPAIATASAGGTGLVASNSADALKGELIRLVRQIAPIIAADPSRKEPLLTLANDANAHRKAGDADGTQAGIAALRRALAAPSSASTAPAHDTGQNQQPAPGPTVPPVVGFLAPAAPTLVEGGGATLLAGGAGTGLLAGGALGGMLLGPQMELQGMAARARTNAFWAAYRELGQVDPANRDAAPFVTNPGWQLGEADLRRVEAALADAKAAKACTADNPTGARPGPARGVPMPGPTLRGSDLLAARPPLAGTPAPPAATTAQPPPMAVPDAGFEHDPNDPDEADLVASMHGRPGTEIQNAINDLRARKRGAGSTGPHVPRQPPTAQPPARSGAAQITPRDGVINGIPDGQPEMPEPGDNQQKREALRLQAASEDAMAKAGYQVTRQPILRADERLTPEQEAKLRPGDIDPQGRVGPKKNPDNRIGGNIFDVVAPTTPKPDRVRDAMSDKVKTRQAYHLVLNLGRTDVTREQIEAVLQRKPITGLQELFIIEKNGAISRIFPNPELVAAMPQVR